MSRDRIGFWPKFHEEFPIPPKDLFQDLIWPAAAGNVAWAFLQVVLGALDPKQPTPLSYPLLVAHLVVLLLVATYLVLDWLRTKKFGIRLRRRYWWFDGALVLSIVWFAIAIQVLPREEAFLSWSLGFVFGIAILGHFAGAWERAEGKNWGHRIKLVICGLLGPAVLIFCHRLGPWNLCLAFFAVLVAWVVVRTEFAPQRNVDSQLNGEEANGRRGGRRHTALFFSRSLSRLRQVTDDVNGPADPNEA
jgi:hypothetical protein